MNQPLANHNEAHDEPFLSRPSTGEDLYEGPQGIGATLRALREAKRVSFAEASGRLKFSSRQLEALENEQWDRLPTGVSLRGLVKNYGRYLGADEGALVTMLDNQVGPTGVKPISVVDAPPLAGADIPVKTDTAPRSWGWLLIILVLLIIVGFYAVDRGWVPDSWLVFDWLRALKS
jgi:cytoskeletal protein RodZ